MPLVTSPLIISTWSFAKRGNDAAWPTLNKGGSSLDAVEKVCTVVETDPTVDSVGFGGLPDANGRVSLDGCVMLAPALGQCGSALFLRRFMHPVSIARRIMEKTNHIMLAGEGAEVFAEHEGFLPADLLSADAQDAYRKWERDRRHPDQSRDSGASQHYIAPRPVDYNMPGGGKLFFHPAPPHSKSSPKSSGEEQWKHHDTVGVLALDARGVLAGACSTSGTPFKMPGRVGDSPIIGHGLFVDPGHGAMVATGTGELISSVCACMVGVEFMRHGADPLSAARQTLQRIMEHNSVLPEHQVALVALRPDGQYAAAALRPGFKVSVVDESGSRVIDPHAVLIE
jgi:isoaspartyl peptidase/L-asparaginase-like protein (Ntn-hydrolase superfamily)